MIIMLVHEGASGGRSNCSGISYKRYKQKYALLVFVPITLIFKAITQIAVIVIPVLGAFFALMPFCA